MNRNEIEATVIDKIMKNILSEENLREIVNLTDEELSKSKINYREKIAAYSKQITDKNPRLHNLYDAIESGKLDVDNINSRIKQLREDIEELEKGEHDIEYKMQNTEIKQIDFNTVINYVKELKPLLQKGSIEERRLFISSFVAGVTVNYPEIEIDYTIPELVAKKRSTSRNLSSTKTHNQIRR